jgi:hypothetical protein
MRGVLFIFVLLIFAANSVLAEENFNERNTKTTSSNFIEQVLINENVSVETINSHTFQINESVASFTKKKTKFKSEKAFLEHVFYKIHKKHLKKYEAYKSFSHLLDKGIYGCLTGTALYAVAMENLGFEYKIIETNYHIYLLVMTNEGEVLMESTDAFSGFVAEKDEIGKRIQESLEEQYSEKNEFNYAINIYNEISMNELIGLQYYNQAVNAYNAQDISESIHQLNESAKYYPSERITGLLDVINQTINNSIDKYLKEYQVLNALVVN